MGSSIDDKVVSIKFDNKAFEANVEKTMSLLDRLKEKLTFDGAGKGLETVANATRGFSLDSIGSAVDSISSKFSTLGVIGFSVINSLVDRAISAGASITKALGLTSVIDGFHEYETAIESTQTILANTKSKGTTLDDVNETLQQLNAYSDKTIFNFGQMTSSLGRFTAAGVDLKTSAESIKGISNLAALSGAKPEEQARAMYQLSQAIASGTLRLEDWNSVEAANIGGETFKNSLFETAKALGTLEGVPINQTFKEWTDAGNNFRLSLQDGWITTDVLTQALSTFTGDLSIEQLRSLGYTEEQAQAFAEVGKTALESAVVVKTWTGLVGTLKEAVGSGFAESYKQIFGDFEGAKTFFTGLNNIFTGIIGNASKARNDRLKTLNELGGREAMIQSLRNVLWAVAVVLSTIGKAFRDAFPRKTASELLVITKSIESFTRKLIPGEKTLNAIGAAFHIIFSILAIGWEVVKAVAGAFADLFGIFGKAASGGASTAVGFFTSLGDSANKLKKSLVDDGGIRKFFENYITPIINFVKQIDISPFITRIVDGFNALKKAITDFAEQHDLGGKLQTMIDKFHELKDTFLGFFDQSGAVESASDTIGGATGRLADRWESFIRMGEKLGGYFDWIEEKLIVVKDALVQVFDKIKEVFASGEFNENGDLLNLGFLAVIFLGLKKLISDFNGLTGGLFDTVKEMFNSFTGVMKAMQTEIKAEAIMKIAIAVAILTASMLVLSLIDTNALSKAFTAMAGGIAALVSAMVILSSISTGPKGAISLTLIAGSLILLAGAVLVLALAMKLMATIEPDRIALGLAAIAAILLSLVAFMQAVPNEGDMIRAGIGIFALASGIIKMAKATERFAAMDPAEMAQGLAGVAASLILLVGAMKHMSGDLGKPAGLILMGIALFIIAKVVKEFASMDMDKMVQGLLGVAAILAIIALTMNTMPPNLLVTAGALVVVAGALYLMGEVIKQIGSMELDTLVKGIVAIAAVLVVLALAAYAMEGAVLGVAAMAAAALALIVLAEAIAILANVGFGSAILAIIALALALTVIAAAAILLTPVIPFIAALGAALIIMGAGLVLVGAGALLFGAGLLLMVLAIGKLVETGGAGFEIITQIIPKLMLAIAKGILDVIQLVIDSIPDIISGVGTIISSIITLLREKIPEFVGLIGTLIDTLITFLMTYWPKIQQAGSDLMFKLLEGIQANIEKVTNIVLDIIFKFLDTMNQRMPEIVAKGAEILTSFLNGIANNIQTVIDAGYNIIKSIIEGIGNNAAELVTCAVDTVIKFVDALKTNSWRIINAAWDFVIDFIRGLTESIETKLPELKDAGGELAVAIIDGMTGGLATKAQEAIDAITGLGSQMKDAIFGVFDSNSPSKEMIRLAGYISDGLVIGLSKDSAAGNSATAFGTDVKNKLTSAISNAAIAMDNMDAFNPTIAPVLDLSNIERGAGRMSKLMETPTIDTTYGYNQAAAISVANKEQTTSKVEESNSVPQTRDVTLTQINNSPNELDQSELYRQTVALISLAKEELTREYN